MQLTTWHIPRALNSLQLCRHLQHSMGSPELYIYEGETRVLDEQHIATYVKTISS